MSCNYNHPPQTVIIGMGFDRAMRRASELAMQSMLGQTTDVVICGDDFSTAQPLQLIVRDLTNFTVSTLDDGPWDLLEPFTNVPSVYKAKCYAPTPKQAKAKKSFTCTGRIRGNYY